MMTLTEFLTARLGEDEAVARRTLGRMEHVPPLTIGGVGNLGIVGYPVARALAEVEAKRRIVDYLTPYDPGSVGHYELRLLALPYADHSHYQQEWKP